MYTPQLKGKASHQMHEKVVQRPYNSQFTVRTPWTHGSNTLYLPMDITRYLRTHGHNNSHLRKLDVYVTKQERYTELI